MWTYNTPYAPDEKTRLYVERRGRLALSRALNIGRVIGFVASGATTCYGQKSWDDLVAEVVKIALETSDSSATRRSGAIRSAHETLSRMKNSGQIKRDATHVLGLASRLATLAGRRREFRREVAKLFQQTRQEQPLKQLAEVDFTQRANPLRSLIADLRLSRLLTLNYDVEIEEEFRRLYRTGGTSRRDVLPRGTGKQEPLSAFDVLCGCTQPTDDDNEKEAMFERALDLPRRVEYSDGTSRSVLSVSMSGDNISDLVNFALHPRQFVGQVVHLHGRFDKPEDMVLTDEDYRQTYMRSDENALCFEEALSALHTGNDILFVGSGMREADILRPLRQFISQDKSPDFAQRHVFAMLEHRVTLNDAWFRNPFGRDRETLEAEFAERHLHHARRHAPKMSGASRDDFNADEQEALRLRDEFGVFALFHGGEALRAVRIAINLLKRAGPHEEPYPDQQADSECKKSELLAEASDPKVAVALRAAARAVRAKLERDDDVFEALLNDNERMKLVQMLRVLDDSLGVEPVQAKALDAALKQCKATKDHLDAIETELRSRALSDAVKQIEKDRQAWWRDWRSLPKERKARFRPRYMDHDRTTRQIPTLARHRPHYSPIDLRGKPATEQFAAIKELQSLAAEQHRKVEEAVTQNLRRRTDDPESLNKQEVGRAISGGHLKTQNSNNFKYFEDAAAGTQRDFIATPPRRVVLGCMPRGFGKGSLLHILQQPDETGRRLVLDGIFPDVRTPTAATPHGRYHGAFCLHLSFSMEFASVISALRDFVEDALIGIMTEHTKLFLKRAKCRLQSAKPEYQDTFLHVLHEHLRGSKASQSRLKAVLESPRDGQMDKNDAAKRIREELIKAFWAKRSLPHGRGRVHRLEQLRLRLSAYTDVVDIMCNVNLRLFIAMSGLDKLCDDRGIAYNPMFRALFRMLTGYGAKYASESDVTAPYDLLLISGRRGAPIRYLSPEIEESEVEEIIAAPGKGGPLDFIAPRQASDKRGRKRYLQDWSIIPPISVSERSWLGSSGRGLFWEVLKQHELRDCDSSRNIRRSLESGVALSSWCAGAIGARLSGTWAHKSDNDVKPRVEEFVQTLDGAIARGGIAQVLREIFEIHKTELRAWGSLLAEDVEGRRSTNLTWPDGACFGEALRAAPTHDPTTQEGNRLVELTYVIMAHLSLFPMPVEPRVLYGCDEIKDLLSQICAPAPGEDDPLPLEKDEKQKEKDRRLALLRKRRLRLLSQVLSYLHMSGLVIAVRGKNTSHNDDEQGSLKLGGNVLNSDDVHTRFTIQHQLREFTARLMDLSVPDQGERNFFQLSIYCDQPRDLPSPNEDHYRLVRDIMERQIKSTRNTIWCMLQLTRPIEDDPKKRPRGFETLSTHEQELVKFGSQRRLFDLELGEGHASPHFESLHAVPNRVRALYGLLRSGFSVGTISRLPGLDDEVPDQPYERFRGWLRGVTNAAISWDYVVDHFFPEDGNENFQVTLERVAEVNGVKFSAEDVKVGRFSRPLYRDEIGWILNERGLMALVTGNIFDAIPLFQRALDEMHHDDVEGYYDPSLHAAVRRVRLNMAIALIERGHLDRAKSSLEALTLPSSFSDHSGSQVSWLSEGYLGLVRHLSGDHSGARAAYKTALERSRDRSMMRSVAIFSKHLADLERRHGDLKKARRYVEDAMDASMQCVQRDVFQLARISRAQLDIIDPEGSSTQVGEIVSDALSFAQAMGVPRIEVEALRLQANLMAAQGDRMLAGRFASRAAAVANRCGLRLQKLSALVAFGNAMKGRGQHDQAQRLLDETKREAERRGYQSIALKISTTPDGQRQ